MFESYNQSLSSLFDSLRRGEWDIWNSLVIFVRTFAIVINIAIVMVNAHNIWYSDFFTSIVTIIATFGSLIALLALLKLCKYEHNIKKQD